MAVNLLNEQIVNDPETILTSIPGFIEEASRHLHSDDINTIEYDYCFVLRDINETCVEQGCSVDVSSDLQVIRECVL